METKKKEKKDLFLFFPTRITARRARKIQTKKPRETKQKPISNPQKREKREDWSQPPKVKEKDRRRKRKIDWDYLTPKDLVH